MKKIISSFLLLLLIGGGAGGHTAASGGHTAGAAEGFQVVFSLKGSTVYIDCYTSGHSFNPEDGKRQASVRVYLDGRELEEKNTAAFSIKNLPPGAHTMKLELMEKGRIDAVYTSEFPLRIQSAL